MTTSRIYLLAIFNSTHPTVAATDTSSLCQGEGPAGEQAAASPSPAALTQCQQGSAEHPPGYQTPSETSNPKAPIPSHGGAAELSLSTRQLAHHRSHSRGKKRKRKGRKEPKRALKAIPGIKNSQQAQFSEVGRELPTLLSLLLTLALCVWVTKC